MKLGYSLIVHVARYHMIMTLISIINVHI